MALTYLISILVAKKPYERMLKFSNTTASPIILTSKFFIMSKSTKKQTTKNRTVIFPILDPKAAGNEYRIKKWWFLFHACPYLILSH